jgi:predicted negative regulator of RcsB-dependent stress response
MKRPQHKKNKESSQEPEAVNVDERNLVDAEGAADLAFEDRVAMYWLENKSFVTGCIVLLALVIIGFNGTRIYQDYVSEQQAASYQEAVTGDTLAEFAGDHSQLALGGFAALKVADTAYEAEDFTRAIEYYTKASSILAGTPLADRAQLGEALAQYKNGDSESALTILEALAGNLASTEGIRAEAAYYLAITAFSEGRTDDFKNFADQVNSLEQARQWQQRLFAYSQELK